jgi:RNA polymerase sigma factor (sigma-70 family)
VEASALQAPSVGIARISLAPRLLRLRSDDQLVALFRAGSDDAFRVIHDRYRQRLFAYTRQMLSSKPDAEDALQDVFIRAHSSLRASDRPIALRAWLYRVAHNRCIDELRRPLPPAVEIMDVSRGPMPDPLAEAERREDLKRLVADMRRLPPQQRSVLLMRELEGLSYADLASTLDVTVPAVKSLLVRARMGLVEAAEARDTACADIRNDLTLAQGRGVRANARARRHLRDCDGCRAYRQDMRRVQRSLAALVPVAGGPLALLSKLTGLGSGGGGGGAASGAAGGGGATAGGIAGGGAATGGIAGGGAATGGGALAGGGLAGGSAVAGGGAAAGGGIAGAGVAAGTGVASSGIAAGSGVVATSGLAAGGGAAASGGIATGSLATATGLAGSGGMVAASGGVAASGTLAASGAAAITAGKVAAVVSAVVVAGSGAAAVEQKLAEQATTVVAPAAVQVQPAPDRVAPAPPTIKPKTDAVATPTDTASTPAKDATPLASAPATTGSNPTAADAPHANSGGLVAPADASGDALAPTTDTPRSAPSGGPTPLLSQPRSDSPPASAPASSTGSGGKAPS